MTQSVLSGAEKYSKSHKRKSRWYRIVICLAAIVVFCTTYALILPAITLEGNRCAIPEHTHIDECWRQITPEVRYELQCTYESLGVHQHSDSCYDEGGNLICGYADFVIHQHDKSCFDEDGELICTLPEIVPHQHTDECYSVPETDVIPVHTHTDGCYTLERGELICEESTEPAHRHTDECYAPVDESPPHEHDGNCYEVVSELTCGLSSEPAHTHSDECYAEQPVLICTSEEADHVHDEGCYELSRELICEESEEPVHEHGAECYTETTRLICEIEEIEESAPEPEDETPPEPICGLTEDAAHTHTDECYEWNRVLICELPTEAAETAEPSEPVEPELICGRDELIPHAHSADCYDSDGNLSCGRLEVSEHIHSDACLHELTEPGDTEVLTCTLPEDENHTHTARCYGTWELVCEFEEHTHSEECQSETEIDPLNEISALIEALPVPETVGKDISAYIISRDADGLNSYLEALNSLLDEVRTAYDALTDEQKEQLTDLSKLTGLELLVGEPIEFPPPVLSDDSAYISELSADSSEIIAGQTDIFAADGTVRSEDKIKYSFNVRAESYSGESFADGRIKLEIILPLDESKAAFDQSDLSWFDDPPEITAQTRVIDGIEVMCQVLTGYKTLDVPGETAGTISVDVTGAAPGDEISLLISAAMEYNTWDGICETHQTEERLTIATGKYTVAAAYSEEEQQLCYEQFKAEIEALNPTDSQEKLISRLNEAYRQGQLTEAQYSELCEELQSLLEVDYESIAEAAIGNNWMLLRDSGWFEAYSDYATGEASVSRAMFASSPGLSLLADSGESTNDPPPSQKQVTNRGGNNTSEDGSVTVSKTIAGTDLENVFDITLQVQTSTSIDEIKEEPDMAVVIVMDISNTMNSNFGGVTRYAAAMTAAEQFLDQFAANNKLGISKVGYVAFNTDAHQIFGLQDCTNENKANSLKNIMRNDTGTIINNYSDNDYYKYHRFTNVEAGLQMAYDMLSKVDNQNKYIIFLSDGFPTTYIESGYNGYNTYDSTGRFYDHVLNKKCLYGTSYSDEAAIRARNKAAAIKATGTTIFSIGVDVAGQTIQQYITQSEGADGFSVVDRTGTTYEIGDASSTEAYKNWLRNSIGSGYYYDSTDSAGLADAYKKIFDTIKHQVEEGSQADWVASDPLPTVSGSPESVEFIGFYNKTPALVSGDLSGSFTEGGENTASFITDKTSISWDLKNSGYTTTTSNGTTTYTYELVYRVRLKNENGSFVEGTIYPTNDTTTLQYRTVEGTDGNLTVSAPKTVEFPIPSVHGYLAELSFTKIDSRGAPLADAEFTLKHDTAHCSACRGDGTSVVIADMKATSNANAKDNVAFTNIPSGHKYTLKETKVPDGYSANGNAYSVEVAYDKITVTVTDANGATVEWNGKIVNNVYYELPQTGGIGTTPYTIGGLVLIASSALLLLYRQTRRGKDDYRSS